MMYFGFALMGIAAILFDTKVTRGLRMLQINERTRLFRTVLLSAGLVCSRRLC